MLVIKRPPIRLNSRYSGPSPVCMSLANRLRCLVQDEWCSFRSMVCSIMQFVSWRPKDFLNAWCGLWYDGREHPSFRSELRSVSGAGNLSILKASVPRRLWTGERRKQKCWAAQKLSSNCSETWNYFSDATHWKALGEWGRKCVHFNMYCIC